MLDGQISTQDDQISDFQAQMLKMEMLQSLEKKKFNSFPWNGNIIIIFWFHELILYDVIWMYLYMIGSQPWYVAIKWCTCIHMMMRGEALREKSICNFFSLLIQTQGKVVVFLAVRSICWIKFQPLWFAILNIFTYLMDKALDILIRIVGFWSFSLKISHRAVPSVNA